MEKDNFYLELLKNNDNYLHSLAKIWIKIISNVRIKCIDQVPKDFISSIDDNEVKFIDDNINCYEYQNKDLYCYSLSFPFNSWTKELEAVFITEIILEANKTYHKIRFVENLRDYLNIEAKREIELNSDFKFSDITSERYDIKPEVCNIIWNYDNTGVSMMDGLKEIFQKVINLLEEENNSTNKAKNETGLTVGQWCLVYILTNSNKPLSEKEETNRRKEFIEKHNFNTSYSNFKKELSNVNKKLYTTNDYPIDEFKQVETIIKCYYSDKIKYFKEELDYLITESQSNNH